MSSVGAAPPFDGLRVLDLTTEIAGGYASKLLVDAGADVLVIEPPTGDPLRRFTSALTPLPTDQDGVLFGFLRASARGLTADPSDPAQVARVVELAQHADVLLGTYVPGAGHWAGIGPDRWLEVSPRLTVVAISPWGSSGPWADRPATEFTVQAACGGTARRGLPARSPGRGRGPAGGLAGRGVRGRGRPDRLRPRPPHGHRAVGGRVDARSRRPVPERAVHGDRRPVVPGPQARADDRGPLDRTGVRRRGGVLHPDRAAVDRLLRPDRSTRPGR